ncbi:unnamed protein product, partial [Heterosigma akashiwo]
LERQASERVLEQKRSEIAKLELSLTPRSRQAITKIQTESPSTKIELKPTPKSRDALG